VSQKKTVPVLFSEKLCETLADLNNFGMEHHEET